MSKRPPHIIEKMLIEWCSSIEFESDTSTGYSAIWLFNRYGSDDFFPVKKSIWRAFYARHPEVMECSRFGIIRMIAAPLKAEMQSADAVRAMNAVIESSGIKTQEALYKRKQSLINHA